MWECKQPLLLKAMETQKQGYVIISQKWAALHQQELLTNWENVNSNKAPEKIEPLD
jgi:hypothetical protein